MNPEIIQLIQTVALDAIKILGPATLASYATYKAAFIQIKIKLDELEKAHQFQAREHIFTAIKNRLSDFDEVTDKLNGDLGKLVGFTSALIKDDDSSELNNFNTVMNIATRSKAKLLPYEIRSTLLDMCSLNLESSDEYKELLVRSKVIVVILNTDSFSKLQSNILELLETYDLLSYCTRLVMNKQMESIFKPYLVT